MLNQFQRRMNSPRWILYHLSIHLVLCGFTLTRAQEDFWARNCVESDNYTQNSAYRKSLDDALFGLTGTDNGYGFYNYSSRSQDGDSSTAVALCKGDIPLDTCRRCVDDATRRLRQVCPVEKEATGWYDNCALRYSNRPILNTLDEGIVYTPSNTNNVLEQFNQVLSGLLDWLRGEAARGTQSGSMLEEQGIIPVDQTIQLFMALCSAHLFIIVSMQPVPTGCYSTDSTLL